MPSDTRGRRDEPVVEVSQLGDAVVVRLAGELDLHNAVHVRRALLDSIDGRPDRVVVDLAEVEFMDSTTLAALVEGRRQSSRPERFLLAAPGLEARRALEVSGLDRLFAVHDTVDAALAAELS